MAFYKEDGLTQLQFRNFFTFQGWSIVYQSSDFFVVENPSGEFQIGIQEFAGQMGKSMNFSIFRDFNPLITTEFNGNVGRIYNQHNGISFDSRYLLGVVRPYAGSIDNTSFMFLNDKRLIFIQRTNGVYQTIYIGEMNLYTTKNEYPLPWVSLGNNVSDMDSSFNPSTLGMFQNRELQSMTMSEVYSKQTLKLRNPYNDWIDGDSVYNYPSNVERSVSGNGLFWNYSFGLGMNGVRTISSENVLTLSQIMHISKNDSGTFDDLEIIGTIDLYNVDSFGKSAESIITIDGAEFMIFPDHSLKTAEDFRYYAIKKD